MNTDEIFVVADDPAPQPEPLEYPKIRPCSFCKGNGHVMSKNLFVSRTYDTDESDGFHIAVTEKIRKAAYVYCGKCKARGPLKTVTLYRPGYTFRDVQLLEISAIDEWNAPF